MVKVGGDEFWLHVNAGSGVPIYLQLTDQLKRAIVGGILRPGDQLPTVREVAGQAVVNPNTVARVYRELEQAGLIETQRGVGTFVARRPEAEDRALARTGMVDAAAERYLAETGQLGLSPAQAAQYILGKVPPAGRTPEGSR